jgi:putative Holliday junction resolvase
MDGSEGSQAKKVRAFGDMLAGLGLTIRTMDERLTTVTAERVLVDGGVRREDRRQHVDKLAAAVILTQWLAAGGQTEA